MIVVNLSSGLGNQLFQYAAGRALALSHKVNLIADPVAYFVDTTKFASRATPRTLHLRDLPLAIHYRSLPDASLLRIRGYPRLRRLLLDGRRTPYMCSGSYTEQFASLPASTVLHGYFQDRRYFLGFEQDIITEVTNALTTLEASLGSGDYVRSPNDHAAVHVRRGDYLRHPEFYPAWFERYYHQVISHLLARSDIRSIHVFSDDPVWCETLVKEFGPALKVLTPDKRFGGALDILAMSRHRVLAIPNSTFSWWAAALQTLHGGEVLAPIRWSEWINNPCEQLHFSHWLPFPDEPLR